MVRHHTPIGKRLAKYTFYVMYLVSGGIIAYFLPENSRYLFGFFMSLVTRWNWRVVKEKEVRHG